MALLKKTTKLCGYGGCTLPWDHKPGGCEVRIHPYQVAGPPHERTKTSVHRCPFHRVVACDTSQTV